MKKVLEGIKVVELSIYASAPMCGRILGDMGAEVVKIEAPQGDPMRAFGVTISTVALPEENPCYQLFNAGKKNICIDLKCDEGKQILFDLLKDANIFFTNTRMNALKKLGLTYDDLKKRFPHLIYGHLSGYGLKGEDANMPGFDSTAYFARSGALLDYAFEDSGPCAITYGVGDIASGMALATGLLGALNKQVRTSEGEYVLVSLFGTAIGIHSLTLIAQQDGKGYNDHFPKDRFMPTTPICNTYICNGSSGGITLTILDHPKGWPIFCKIIEREDLADDPCYNTAAASKQPENSKFLVTLISKIFAEHDRDYWVKLLKEYDLPFSIAQHFSDIQYDPMAWENGYLTKFTYRNGNTGIVPNIPIQFKENSATPGLPAVDMGSNTNEVLIEIGYSAAQIQELRTKKAVK